MKLIMLWVTCLFLMDLLGFVGTIRSQDPGHATAESVAKAIAEIESLAKEQIVKDAVPGVAISVVFKDKVVYASGFGVRDASGKMPVNADTVFQIASASKPVGATVVAALVGEKKITWDSRISDLDPGFAMHDPWVTREITIRDFYCHRSGLPDHAGDLLEDIGYSREQVLYRLRFQQPESSFRSKFDYTNFGMTEAAVAAAKAYGLSWEDASELKLYRPLGMNSTSSRYADFLSRTNRAASHVWVDGKWVHKIQRQPDAQSPAGGVSSSVNDLARWMRLQLANGSFNGSPVVNRDALLETRRPHMLTRYAPLTGEPGFYGLGWNVSYDRQNRQWLNHSGAFALGAGTMVCLVPGEQLGIVVLTNAYPVGVAEGLAFTFLDLALYGEVTRNWLVLLRQYFSDPANVGITLGFDYSKPPASPTPARDYDAYLGTYSNDLFGDISIIRKDHAMALVMGPLKMTFPLKHYDREVFTYESTGENAVGTTGVRFMTDSSGQATQVLIEHLDPHGKRTFFRSGP